MRAQRGQSPVGFLIVAAVMVVLVIAIVPTLVALSSGISLQRAIERLELEGYTAYANPGGDLLVKNVYPRAASTYELGASANRFTDLWLSGTVTAGGLAFSDGTSQTTAASTAATVVVCASSSSNLGRCDYTASGTSDEVTILAGYDEIPSSGGTLVLRPGVYSFSATLTLYAKTERVLISGYGALLDYRETDGTSAIAWSGGAPKLTFRGFSLTGQNIAAGHGIYGTGGGWIVFDDVRVYNFSATGKYGIYLYDMHGVTVRSTGIDNNANGLYVEGTYYRTSVLNSDIKRNDARQMTLKGVGADISGNYFDTDPAGGTTDSMIYLIDSTFSFTRNKVDDAGSVTPANAVNMLEITQGTSTFGSQGWTVSGNGFEYVVGFSGTKYQINISKAASDGVIEGNDFVQRNTAISPIQIENVTSSRVRDITVGTNTWAGSKPPVYIADQTARNIEFDFLERASYNWSVENLAAAQTDVTLSYSEAVGTADLPWVGKRAWPVGIEVKLDAAVPTGETLTIKVGSNPVGGTQYWSQDIVNADGTGGAWYRNAFYYDTQTTLGGGGVFRVTATSTDLGAWVARDVQVRVVMAEQYRWAPSISP